MFRDLLSHRAIQVGLVFFVVVFSGSLLYSWQTRRATVAEFIQTDAVLHEARSDQDTVDTNTVDFEQSETSLELDDSQMAENTDVSLIDETSEMLEMADAFLPDDVVSEEAPAEDVQVSRFGLGPYPEIPKEWNFLPNYWETVDSIERELLRRVTIKMHNEGIRSKYGSVGINPSTGLIIPLERGSVLVEYEIDENGEKRIYRTLAHPDDLPQGMYTRFSQIPSDLKIVTADEIAFDPYEYLGLPK